MQDDFLQHQYRVLGIAEILARDDVNEICINQPGHLYVENQQGWQRVEVPGLTWERALQFCTTVVNHSHTGQRITAREPLVSLTFPTGQRAQLVIPPAVEAGSISITLRQPARQPKTLQQYEQEGFFAQIADSSQEMTAIDKELLYLKYHSRYLDFFKKAVLYRKNIVVAGATGSGKTTFMKSLVQHIPDHERLVTIEDARELFVHQPNVVHMLYSKGGQGLAPVTAKTCMEACLRMKPDRIILAELRGDEAFYFIRNCASGHPGSITSCHAGSVAQTWDQLALMVKASPEGAGLELEAIQRLLRLTVDIIVHVQVRAGQRYISGLYFDPERQRDA